MKLARAIPITMTAIFSMVIETTHPCTSPSLWVCTPIAISLMLPFQSLLMGKNKSQFMRRVALTLIERKQIM
jgi:hypothetical protein